MALAYLSGVGKEGLRGSHVDSADPVWPVGIEPNFRSIGINVDATHGREERRMLRLAYPRAVARWWFIESLTATAIFSAGGRKK
jgi:hypothetical protein